MLSVPNHAEPEEKLFTLALINARFYTIVASLLPIATYQSKDRRQVKSTGILNGIKFQSFFSFFFFIVGNGSWLLLV